MLMPVSCREVRLLLLEPSRWSILQKYGSIMKGLTLDQLHTFVTALKAELYVEGLVQGNFTSTVSTHVSSSVFVRPTCTQMKSCLPLVSTGV